MATERLDIIVKLNDSSKAGSRAVKKNLKGIDVAASQASKSIKALGASLLGITAVFAAGRGFTNALKIFTEFDDVMRQVGAVTNATAEEFENLTDVAKEMGATTRFTASQAAEGLKFLGLAGFEAAEAAQALPDVLNLAAAGSLELGQAADITTNILAAFGFEVEQLGFVNDVLVKTFTSSNNNLIELGEAFKLVGPIAKGVGANFEDLLAAIGKLGDAGLKASIGGTSLRGTLAALFNPTREEAKLMAELSERIGGVGLQIKDANGNFIGFTEIIKQLEKAALTGDEALKLFGLRAGPGVAALLNQGSEALEELQLDLLDAGGTADKIATQMEDGIGGATREMIAALESLKITFIDVFGDAISNGIVKVTEDMRGLTKVIDENRIIFNYWADVAVRLLDKVSNAAKATTNRFLAVGKAIALFGLSLTGTERNIQDTSKVIKDEIQEILFLLGKERPEIQIEVAEPDLSSFDNFKSKLENFKLDIKIDPVAVFDSALAEAKLKSGLIRLRAVLDKEAAKIEGDYKNGIIDLEQYFEERESIVRRQLRKELQLLNAKLDKETDNSKKALLAAAVFAKEQQLQKELIELEQEKLKEFKKIEKQKNSELNKNLQIRLKTEQKAVQADKLINDLKIRNSIITSNKLEDVFKNEQVRLQQRQSEELERFKKNTEDELKLIEFANLQKIELEKLLENQKRRLQEDTVKKQAQLDKILNDIKFRNALSTSTALEEIQRNEIAELDRRQQEELERFSKFTDDKAKILELSRQQELEKDNILVQQKKALKEQELQNAQTITGQLAQLSNDLFTLAGSNNKELFALSQAAAVADATMSAYVAANKALELGPIAGPISAAIIIAQALANVARITSQSLADGGMVQGHSPHSKADNINANLTAGEHVTKVSAVKDFGTNFMNLVNSQAPTEQIIAALSNRGKLTNFSLPSTSRGKLSFADGGSIPRQAISTIAGASSQAFNIINVLDPSQFSQFLNTSEGKNAVLNVIGSKAKQVKRILA